MKLFWNINDLELIYLIKEQNEVAYNLMYKKYFPLVAKLVFQLGLKADEKEEFIQEGLLQLEVAIYTYNEKYEKSFYAFFKFILERKLYRLNTKNRIYHNKFVQLDEKNIPAQLKEKQVHYAPISDINFKNEQDKLIYEEVILGNRSIKSLCKQHNLEPKRVYNRVYMFKNRHKK